MGILEGKVAIITGAARGMGEAEARLLHAEGAMVVLTDFDEAGAAIASDLGAETMFVRHDVGDEASWNAVAEAVAARHGRLDILINNAGINRHGSVADTSLEDWEQVIRVNQTSVFLGIKSVVPLMERAGSGSIVNISSAAGLRAAAGLFSYTASKWAVRGMTKCAALELADRRIRVNSIHPGVVTTPMGLAVPEEIKEQITNQIPMRRWGEPIEIARVALFLCSEQASYMTGAELAVDGGTVV